MIGWIKAAPWVIAGLVLVVCALLWWRLEETTEKIGALQQTNNQLTADVAAKDAALASRARTDSEIRNLPPADILNRMR